MDDLRERKPRFVQQGHFRSHGHPVIHAYGGERGFQSDMMLCPEEGVGVIAMGNGQAGGDFFAPTTAVDVMGMLLAQ